ncbi:MAG: hypothetical protein LIR50_05475 [Bacillota bacterium]|nr:hypothetical protein [Bacillota bacterium]
MKRKLNLNKLKNGGHIGISSKEALRDIVLFDWSNEILEGKKKIIIK